MIKNTFILIVVLIVGLWLFSWLGMNIIAPRVADLPTRVAIISASQGILSVYDSLLSNLPGYQTQKQIDIQTAARNTSDAVGTFGGAVKSFTQTPNLGWAIGGVLLLFGVIYLVFKGPGNSIGAAHSAITGGSFIKLIELIAIGAAIWILIQNPTTIISNSMPLVIIVALGALAFLFVLGWVLPRINVLIEVVVYGTLFTFIAGTIMAWFGFTIPSKIVPAGSFGYALLTPFRIGQNVASTNTMNQSTIVFLSILLLAALSIFIRTRRTKVSVEKPR